MKVCKDCKKSQPKTNFHWADKVKGYIHSYCKPCHLIRNSASFRRNKRNSAISCKKWAQENSKKKNQINKKWQGRNRAKCNAIKARYRAKKLQATPKWLQPEELKQIETLYQAAANLTQQTGHPHHVDHIIPLQGEIVSGLHVFINLQVITAKENLQKSNKYQQKNIASV